MILQAKPVGRLDLELSLMELNKPGLGKTACRPWFPCSSFTGMKALRRVVEQRRASRISPPRRGRLDCICGKRNRVSPCCWHAIYPYRDQYT
jgi:hypothetical protein